MKFLHKLIASVVNEQTATWRKRVLSAEKRLKTVEYELERLQKAVVSRDHTLCEVESELREISFEAKYGRALEILRDIENNKAAISEALESIKAFSRRPKLVSS